MEEEVWELDDMLDKDEVVVKDDEQDVTTENEDDDTATFEFVNNPLRSELVKLDNLPLDEVTFSRFLSFLSRWLLLLLLLEECLKDLQESKLLDTKVELEVDEVAEGWFEFDKVAVLVFKFEFKFDSEDSRELTYLEDKFGLISDWTISCLASEDLPPIFFLLIFIFNPLSTVAWCSTVLAAFAADGEDEDEEEEWWWW